VFIKVNGQKGFSMGTGKCTFLMDRKRSAFLKIMCLKGLQKSLSLATQIKLIQMRFKIEPVQFQGLLQKLVNKT
jgi:hypothetical protein